MGYKTASAKTEGFNKEIPDKIIGQFNTLNETGRGSYFDQICRKRASGHS